MIHGPVAVHFLAVFLLGRVTSILEPWNSIVRWRHIFKPIIEEGGAAFKHLLLDLYQVFGRACRCIISRSNLAGPPALNM